MTLLRTCLEGAVLAAAVAAACLLVPRMRPAHRAMLWWLVAAKLLIGLLPLPAVPIAALSAPAEAPVSAATAATPVATTPIEALRAAIPSPPAAIDLPWGLLLWLAGAAALFACALPGWLQARSWRRAGRPIDDSDVALAVARAARVVGLGREPRVLAVPGLPGPLVTGLLRPTILLPVESLARLRPAGSASLPMSPHALLRRRLQMIESIVRRVPLTRAGWALVVLATLALVPVRLVAKEDATRCLDVGNDVESAYVITSGKNHAMCGDVADVREAERARGGGGDVLWFRIGDDRWVIRDPEAVAQGRRHVLAMRELGERQSEMAADQADVARRQAMEERRLAELDASRHRELAEQERRAATEARAKFAEDADREMQRLSEQMAALSRRMQELGGRQQELGDRQRALSEFLEDAIRSGRAERAE